MNLLQIRKVQRCLWAPGWIKGNVSAQNLQVTQSSLTGGGGGGSSQQPIFALSLRILQFSFLLRSPPPCPHWALCQSVSSEVLESKVNMKKERVSTTPTQDFPETATIKTADS